jgi:hypothetical protein
LVDGLAGIWGKAVHTIRRGWVVAIALWQSETILDAEEL